MSGSHEVPLRGLPRGLRNLPASVSVQEVEAVRQEWLAKVRSVIDAMRRNVDWQSAATAARTGDARQAVAIVELCAGWCQAEQQVADFIKSPETAEAIRRLLLSDDVARATKHLDFLRDWLTRGNDAKDFMRDVVFRKVPKDQDGGDIEGPVLPDGFRHGGTVYHGIPKGPFLALAAAWARDGRCIHKDDLAAALGDSKELLADNAMPSIRGVLNAFFREHKIPYHAKVSGLHLAIQDGLPRGAGPAKAGNAKRRHSR